MSLLPLAGPSIDLASPETASLEDMPFLDENSACVVALEVLNIEAFSVFRPLRDDGINADLRTS